MLAMAIVGTSVSAGKFVTLNLPVNISMCLRFCVGSLFLYGFIRLKKKAVTRLSLKDAFIVALQAFLGSVLFNVLLLQGLKTASAVSAGIITGTTPVMVSILAVVVLKEKLSFLKLFFVLTAVAGIILVSLPDISASGNTLVLGIVFIIWAVFAESCFLIMRKTLRQEIDSLNLSLYLSLFGVIYFGVLGIGEIGSLGFTEITMLEAAIIVYYGIFITAIAYILWMEGIRYVDAMTASVYTAVMPVSAVLSGIIFLNETIDRVQLLGFAAVLLSMGMVIYNGRRNS